MGDAGQMQAKTGSAVLHRVAAGIRLCASGWYRYYRMLVAWLVSRTWVSLWLAQTPPALSRVFTRSPADWLVLFTWASAIRRSRFVSMVVFVIVLHLHLYMHQPRKKSIITSLFSWEGVDSKSNAGGGAHSRRPRTPRPPFGLTFRGKGANSTTRHRV